MRRLPLAVLLASLAALPALAQEKAEIKASVKKGLKFTRTSEIKGEGECRIDLGGQGEMAPMKAELSYELKHIEEVLDVKDGKPVDLHRAYPSRKSTLDLKAFGRQEQSHPLEGADITCKGGVWAVVGGESAEEAAKVISKERAVDPLTDALSSGKVVSVGNTWDADKAKVKDWLESEFPGFEATETEMDCKLGEFREKDGQKCARIEIKAKAKGKLSIQNSPQSEVSITMEGDVYYSLDSGIVVAVKGKGSMKAEMEIKGAGQDAKMNLDLPCEWSVSVKVGEAAFEAKKPADKPKKERPEYYPPPVR